MRLLIAASGTGGHVFPAIATAEQLRDYQIEWLGVPDRLETQLVGDYAQGSYPLHTISVAGFQQKLGLGSLKVLLRLIGSIRQVRRLLKQGKFDGVFTTGGYIAAPAILAARSLGLPVILHESNALPGKVTRWFAPWCSVVAIGFQAASDYLPRGKTICVGTPVRSQFRSALDDTALEDLSIPKDVPLIVVVGGSQGAVALNKLVRKAAPAWFDAGAWVVHLTGDSDPDAQRLQHSQYVVLPFYDNMAALFQRANLAISRSGAGTLTELAITHTPSILIPYPFAAEDHQAFNAAVFAEAGAAEVYRQADLTSEVLEAQVLMMLKSPDRLQQMAKQAASLAVVNSAEQLAQLIRRGLG
ncbi:undecaprenyldiphospho-muramoylpentapeptide beta-N-acetylglucosaminyltransferase [Phormidesmis priestleyi ULC007]|uniref:UDP-N-acetylglucosamine--N-acetylmuramyl-(pentapeptide) pyrophosphoryl-undecaprenol N-acetylglucosamine transferase n=1 Tax=Phormidesmis priestleyi ULC007 TaxID=1920490 RepID=A0A2T1DJN7_9CYAN|nr:undecaprenyldiphospho-muramoylpentapeptide beta-N-acetylglucosaminyltransferase [Phormidesmis priestleyi ULC007]PZO54349.1 MAG: undecaprenyldiphospho-muramoylpentapeptide beta-N-acetylglucosaminyltransferase [Phormidesmis priestleyi]